LLEESLALRRELGDQPGVAASLLALGEVALSQGDRGLAESVYEESLAIQRELGDLRGFAECVEGLACLAAAGQQPERALRLAGAASTLRASIGVPLSSADQQRLDQRLKPASNTRSGEAGDLAWSEGQRLSVEQTGAYVLEHAEPTWFRRARSEFRRERSAGQLTSRELEVARLIASGKSNHEISLRLVIAPGTAERHVANILNKLALRSRTEVALWAVEHGLDGARPT